VRIPLWCRRLSFIRSGTPPGEQGLHGGQAHRCVPGISPGPARPVTSRKAWTWRSKAVTSGRDGWSGELAERQLCSAVAAPFQLDPHGRPCRDGGDAISRGELVGERLNPAHPQQVMSQLKPALSEPHDRARKPQFGLQGPAAHETAQTNKMTFGAFGCRPSCPPAGPATGKSAAST